MEGGNSSTSLDAIREQCRTNALYAFGTAYIFEQRAHYLRRRLRLITFLGIAVPAVGGASVLALGAASHAATVLISVLAVLGIAQFVVSIWAVICDWQGEYTYALESCNANMEQYSKYDSLGKDPPSTANEAKAEFRLIEALAQCRDELDMKSGMTDQEKRMGMRAALRQLQKACAGCEKIPTSMVPTDCSVCGRFRKRRF